MRAERDGQTTASGNAEVAATPSGADGGGLFGELVPANTKLIPPSLARNFGILEALLVAANEASNRSSDGSGSKGGSGPGTGGKDNRGGPGGYDAEPGDGAAGTLPPRRQDGNTRRRATEHGGPGGDAASGGLAKRRRTADDDGCNAQQGAGSGEQGGVAAGAAAEPANSRKPRLVWSPPLHKRFVDAVSYLGLVTAVPKRIMELMNVEGLTRENVASHLQKYRLYMTRLQTSSQKGAEDGKDGDLADMPEDSDGQEPGAAAGGVDGDDDTV